MEVAEEAAIGAYAFVSIQPMLQCSRTASPPVPKSHWTFRLRTWFPVEKRSNWSRICSSPVTKTDNKWAIIMIWKTEQLEEKENNISLISNNTERAWILAPVCLWKRVKYVGTLRSENCTVRIEIRICFMAVGVATFCPVSEMVCLSSPTNQYHWRTDLNLCKIQPPWLER